ncbi:uncharacterized protein LOC114251685 [Bombyx mandarina]|uniref:Uncharacterized protein LOC114251685 n=1 Tax=Bombyx mandarina TaxID=7092 RepID=A0A6J2KNW0_BOMMA|nr:uncharacterized protein LOC114251685 [Bombyx mandarina]
MNYEDYVRHMKHKYSLAIAIAVLKTKPENVTTDVHLANIKQRINSDDADDDDDVTVCSDDFVFDVNDPSASLVDIKNDGPSRIDDTLRSSNETYCESGLRETANANRQSDNGNITDQRILDSLVITDELTSDDVVVINNQKCDDTTTLKSIDGKIRELANGNSSVAAPISKEINNAMIIEENYRDSDNVTIEHQVFDVLAFQNDRIEDGLQNNFINPQKQNEEYLSDVLRTLNELDTRDDYLSQSTFHESSQDRVPSLSEDPNHCAQNPNEEFISRRAKKTKCINLIDSQETIICSLPESFNHYSQSQTQNFVIGEKLIQNFDTRNKNRQIDVTLCDNNKELINQNNDVTDCLFSSTDSSNQRTASLKKFSSNATIDSQFNEAIIEDNEKLIRCNNENVDFDSMKPQKEAVPFKVIGEINKVKTFLQRRDSKRICDGYSSDSGYKSDWPIKLNVTQQSGSWLNQAGHCLYSHIISCNHQPTTEDITNEVSQVLGDLIDRLHEEELYPEFLEELLNYIELTLKRIYEDNDFDNILLNKDEKIQRIILLCGSMHVKKYTIDRLLDCLNDLYEKLNLDETEIKHINLIENACYVFHLLELIISKYMKKRNLFSQSSSQSQDDERSLKKSSITEIWRKKWIPNYGDVVSTSDVTEKVCIEIRCSEVLNKIVVGCMDGYSLLSYSALKCFNLLQP